MLSQADEEHADYLSDDALGIGAVVRVYPGTDREARGTLVEDFGEISGTSVDIGEHHIVDAARRWAVQLDDGALVFVDDDDVSLNPST